jgi:hypothetical protein
MPTPIMPNRTVSLGAAGDLSAAAGGPAASQSERPASDAPTVPAVLRMKLRREMTRLFMKAPPEQDRMTFAKENDAITCCPQGQGGNDEL